MLHVMVFELFPKWAFKGSMMEGIMRNIIKKISANKHGKGGRNPIRRQNSPEKKIETGGQGNAYRRGQDQPQGIVRVVVVDAVKNKVKTLAPFRLGFEMENKPVHHI